MEPVLKKKMGREGVPVLGKKKKACIQHYVELVLKKNRKTTNKHAEPGLKKKKRTNNYMKPAKKKKDM